jgi:hypothetical protein
MLTLFIAQALAGPPPCTPIDTDLYMEGEHFWVQWDESRGNEVIAENVLEWAEEARATYIDMGWPASDQTILIRIQEASSSGGLCSTAECEDGTVVPLITLFSARLGEPGLGTTKHEVAHTFEYGYIGTYIDAISSWSWWTEGTAVWLTTYADDNIGVWHNDVQEYLERPWTGLHQTPLAYSDPEMSPYLYGTAFVAQYMDDKHGPDSVRQTWEYSADHAGTPVFFPDAIEAIGLDWTAFWQDYMATITVADMPYGPDLSDGVFIEDHVPGFPASGAPKKKRQPQGLGLSIIHFKGTAGVEGADLEVTFEGDPATDWMAILVRTEGTGPGGSVEEIVPMDVDANGVARATLADFDGSRQGYLVVSPMTIDLEPRDYAWSAQLTGMPDAKKKGGKDKGCGCDSPAAPAGLLWAALGALAIRRRR